MTKKTTIILDSYKKEVFYQGNLDLLNNKKISIVGSRRPNNYTKSIVSQLSKKLSNAGVTIVSGGAMGVDIIAHEFAEIVAREKGIGDHREVDKICVERGYGKELLKALLSDFLPGTVERTFIDRRDLIERIENLRRLIE